MCSEIENNTGTEQITEIINENNEVIGIECNGGYNEYIYGEHILPTVQITIYRDGKKVILEERLKLNIYTYDLETKQETYQRNTTPDIENNFYSFNADGYNIPICFKFKLADIDEQGQEVIYELKENIVNFTGYGERKVLELELETVNPDANGGNDDGILTMITGILDLFKEFVTNIVTWIAEGIKEALTFLFIPDTNILQNLITDLYDATIGNIPILQLPMEVLKYFAEDEMQFWVNKSCGINWQPIEFMGITIWEGGSINFVDFVESNSALKSIRQIWLIISDGILAIYFMNYIKTKFDQIFGST